MQRPKATFLERIRFLGSATPRKFLWFAFSAGESRSRYWTHAYRFLVPRSPQHEPASYLRSAKGKGRLEKEHSRRRREEARMLRSFSRKKRSLHTFPQNLFTGFSFGFSKWSTYNRALNIELWADTKLKSVEKTLFLLALVGMRPFNTAGDATPRTSLFLSDNNNDRQSINMIGIIFRKCSVVCGKYFSNFMSAPNASIRHLITFAASL